jgi:hypothetical protein
MILFIFRIGIGLELEFQIFKDSIIDTSSFLTEYGLITTEIGHRAQTNSIVVDNDNTAWAACNGGLFQFRDEKWEKYTFPDSILYGTFKLITYDKKRDVIWLISERYFDNYGVPIETDNGSVYSNRSGNWKEEKKFTINDNYFVSSIAAYDGNFWLATHDANHGIYHFNGTEWEEIEMVNDSIDLIRYQFSTIFLDSYGTLYAALYAWDKRDRILRYDGENWETIELPFDLGWIGWSIPSIYIDRRKDLWIGLYNVEHIFVSTVFIFRNETSTWDTIEEMSKYQCVKYIEEDSEGNLWFGTVCHGWGDEGGDTGLVVYDGEQFHHFDTLNSTIPSNHIHEMKADNNGGMWIAFNEPWVGDIIYAQIKYNDVKKNSNTFPHRFRSNQTSTRLFNNPGGAFTIKTDQLFHETYIYHLDGKLRHSFNYTGKAFGERERVNEIFRMYLPAGVYVVKQR